MTKKHSTAAQPKRKRDTSGLLTALRALSRAIETHADDVPAPVRRSMQRVWDELAELERGDSDPSGGTGHEYLTEEGRRQVGAQIKRKQRGRHDTKRPSGSGKRTYGNGYLFEHPAEAEDWRRATELARQLVWTLASRLYVPNERRTTDERLTGIGELKHALSKSLLVEPVMPGQTAALEGAYELIAGEAYGVGPDWRTELVRQLEWDEHHREELRLQQAHGDVPLPMLGDWEPDPNGGATCGPANGDQILRHLRHIGAKPPPELTSARIDEMREQVGFGAGGPTGKRKAKKIVDEFVSKFID